MEKRDALKIFKTKHLFQPYTLQNGAALPAATGLLKIQTPSSLLQSVPASPQTCETIWNGIQNWIHDQVRKQEIHLS